MKTLLKLVFADARQRPARMALTSLAMIAAACMVVWVVSGYDALMGQFDSFSANSLGRYELVVVPEAVRMVPGVMPVERHVDPAMLESLKQDPAVAFAEPVMQSRIMFRKFDPANPVFVPMLGMGGPGMRPTSRPASGPATQRTFGGMARGGPGMRRPMSPMLVGTNSAKPPFDLKSGRWIDPAHPERLEAAISGGSAEQHGIALGDEVWAAPRGGEAVRLKIVGIVEQSSQPTGGARFSTMLRGPAASALYVPTALAEKITGAPAKISYVGLALKPEADLSAFRAAWSPRIAAAAAELQSPEDVMADLSEGFSANGMRNQAWSATGISLLAALFIIFTTLSMGVSERARQFAVLRAVALTRSQVAMLIFAEGLILALIGWGGGLLAGWGLLWVTRLARPESFAGGASLGAWCVLLSGLCAFGGSLAASVLPAWRATRVRPMDALAPRAVRRQGGWPVVTTIAGLALVAVNPLLVFLVPMADESRYGIYVALGCTSMGIGFILLAPLAVLIAEKAFGPVLARVLCLEPGLLTTQLTSNLWRTVGTTVAMTIGLGLFVAMQIWGYSMLKPFVPGAWVPDVMVSVLPTGLDESEINAVCQINGIAPGQCLPLAVEQPRLADDLTHSQARATVTRQDNVVLIGLDPQRGLGGGSPLLDLHFVQGDRDSAIRQLQQGRYCIVPDHFQRETGLGVGGKFRLVPPNAPDQPVEYTIAGVVELPGWHWMTKFSGVRMNSARSAAMVFAPYDAVRKDFQLDRVRFFWMNTAEGTSPQQIGAAVQAVAERSTGTKFNIAGFGFPSMEDGSTIRLTSADEVRARIAARADGIIWDMSQLFLVTLVVTSLGVINAMMASVRARRWDMGVLRAVGFTRFTLVRLVIAEAVLVGLVACLLSLGFGVMAGWCGAGISQYVNFFGGLNPSLVIPWSKLSLGLGSALLLCILAALWPAISTGRAEPLRLLQAGRTAM